jgi:hypothetical protein
LYDRGAGLDIMSGVGVDQLVVSRAELGRVAVFCGFDRDELRTIEHDWGFAVEARGPGSCEAYLIECEEWSDRAVSARVGAAIPTEGLARVAAGEEDALVGAGGVAWLAAGRRRARVTLDPGCTDRFAVDEVIGAALTHALALAGHAPVHGLAAEIGGLGVLALGESMAGKSTLALAILHAGGRVVSDDLLLTTSVAGRPVCGAFRRDLYIRQGSYSLIPEHLRVCSVDDDVGPGRRVLRRDAAPEVFVAEVSPSVVWFLDQARGAGDCEVTAMSQAEALASLVSAGSPLFVSGRYHTERAVLLPRLVEVAQSARSFSVRLGPGLLRAPGTVVRELLARTGPGRG